MAFRSSSYYKQMARHLIRTTTYATSTSPKMQVQAQSPTKYFGHLKLGKKLPLKGDFVPVYVALGMIAPSVSLGLYTVKQQALHSPNVRVDKKKREIVLEVEEPESVVEESEKFVNKSFFKKVAHLQEFQSTPDPTRKDIFGHQQRVENLKPVGVDPKEI